MAAAATAAPEPGRFTATPTAHGFAVMDRSRPGDPVVRSGLGRPVAKRIERALNEQEKELAALREDNVFLRAMLRNQGVEIRPARRAG